MEAVVTGRHVVFSHGQESGPWGRKISALAEVARSEGYDAHSVDYRGIVEENTSVAERL
jgi:predicted alpha/beta hydrolase